MKMMKEARGVSQFQNYQMGHPILGGSKKNIH